MSDTALGIFNVALTFGLFALMGWLVGRSIHGPRPVSSDRRHWR